jgi:hypothetical protein
MFREHHVDPVVVELQAGGDVLVSFGEQQPAGLLDQ